MNRFTVELTTDTRYPNELNKAPVLIVDRIMLTPKLLNAQVRSDAQMHLLKDIAAQQLSKKIVSLMNHRSISDIRRNLHYEEFSFTYAEKDELDILRQQLKARTSDIESKTEQYNRTYNDLQKAEEYLKYITDKYMKAQKQVKFQYVAIGILSASIVSFIIALGAN